MVLQGNVPGGKTVTDGGYRFPLCPVFWGFLGSVNGQIDGPTS